MAAKMPHVCDFRAAVSLVKEKRGTQLSNGQMLGMVASMMSAAGDTKASVCVGRARDLCVGDLSTMSRFECILFVEELLRQDGIVVLSPRREHDQKMLRMASERKVPSNVGPPQTGSGASIPTAHNPSVGCCRSHSCGRSPT